MCRGSYHVSPELLPNLWTVKHGLDQYLNWLDIMGHAPIYSGVGIGQIITKSARMSKIALLLLVGVSGLWLGSNSANSSDRVSYWLWAGLTAHDVPTNSELYIYQGRIYTDSANSTYERQGLFPHPLKSSKLFLVYRLEGQLPTAEGLVDIFEHSLTRWQRHPVAVTGIQLDFDSPTSKLIVYSRFLEDVRRQLPKQYALSVTGLGDWVMTGNQEAMRSITISTDEIVFQLYQGRQPLEDIEDCISELAHYSLPFRIGLVSGFAPPESAEKVRDNPNFHGIIYFVLRDK